MPNNSEIDFTSYDLDRLIVDIFNGSITPSNLPVNLYKATFNRLFDAVCKGFANTLDELNDGTPEKLLLKYYEHNISIFSGAKTFQQVNDFSNAVFTPDGYKRSFSDFKKLITGDEFHGGMFKMYNVDYLKTEYNTAVRVAQMGRQFTEYYKEADLFPFLKYIAVHDERVRADHLAFDGVTLPVSHKFWDTHSPPNGFNCRCRVIQLSEYDDFTVTPESDVKNLPDPDAPLFGFNPAKSGFIFDPSKHPYTAKIGERFAPASSINFGFPTPEKPLEPIVIPEIKKAKKRSVPKVDISSLTLADKIANFKTAKEGREITKQLFDQQFGRPVKTVTLSKDLTTEQLRARLIELNRLSEKYVPIYEQPDKLIDSVKFSSTSGEYGSVTTEYSVYKRADGLYYMRTKAFNGGHKTGSFISQKLDEKSTFFRQFSRVDADKNEISTITHEFAHFIGNSRYSTRKTATTDAIKPFFDELEVIQKEYETFKRGAIVEMSEYNLKERAGEQLTAKELERIKFIQNEHLGTYASKNIDEFFAESFAEYELSSNPSPTAQKVGKLAEKYFARKNK